MYFKAVKGAHMGSALTVATSELTNSNRKKDSHKTQVLFLKEKLRASFYTLIIMYKLNLKEKGNQNLNKNKPKYCSKLNKLSRHTGHRSPQSNAQLTPMNYN